MAYLISIKQHCLTLSVTQIQRQDVASGISAVLLVRLPLFRLLKTGQEVLIDPPDASVASVCLRGSFVNTLGFHEEAGNNQ